MSVHKDSKTNNWYFRKRITNLDGSITNIRRRGFKTKGEAKKAEILFVPDLTPKISFETLCDNYFLYLETKYKPSTIYSKKIMINKYIREYFKNSDIENITKESVINWINRVREQKLKIKRVNKIIAELNCLIEYGEKFYNIENNPCRVIGRIKDNSVKTKKMDIWTPQEFSQFISVCDNLHYYTLFNFMYYTGVRLGEALAITWEDFNKTSKQISINKTMCQKLDTTTNNNYIVTAPKTSSGNRIIDLPSKLYEILLEYEKYTIKYYKGINLSKFIFGYNKPLSETSICRYKNNYCKLANVKQIRLHDLRHSHASLLINLGINPLFISERLGHKNVSTTLNVYSHLFPTNQREIVQKIDEFIS